MFDSNNKTHSPASRNGDCGQFRQRLAPPTVGSVTMSMTRLIFSLVGFIGLVGFAGAVHAQEPQPPKVIPIGAKFRDVSTENLTGDARRAATRRNSEARKARNAARDAAREGISSGNMVPVKEYFNGYVFPQMTQPAALKESGALRDSFFRTFMKSDVDESSRKKVISAVILPAMQAIATGKDYAPSARLNAIALLGRLDESALVKSGTRVRPPRPSAAAFGFLSGLLEDETAPAWLKAAAIQGIVRHLKVDVAVGGRLLDDNQRNLVQAFAFNTLDGKTAGQADWSKDLDYWLKRRSVQLLGAVGRQGEGGKVIDRLTSIANDESQTVWMQLDAVKALRTIDFTGAQESQVSKAMVSATLFLQRQLANEDAAVGEMLEDLIDKNILYGDTDFVVTGTKYTKNIAKSSGGSMETMMSAGDMDDMMGEGMEMGMGMGMGTSGRKMEEPVILVELPTYQLNLIRRRMKIFAFTANDVLQNATGIDSAASAKDKQLQKAIAEFTADFLKDSSIGVIDIGKKKDEDEDKEIQKKSYTDQLRDVCRDGASDLKRILLRHAGGGGGLPDPSDIDAPAVDDPIGLGG